MSHFNLKSLVFYGIAITSVALLFKVVTDYGETHLKAPPLITSRYRLQAENLPECLRSEPLLLTIQQSGIYLNGALIPEKSLNSSEEPLSLSGEWLAPNLTLSGSVPHLSACNPSGNQGKNQVTIQGFWDKNSLKGQITLYPTKEVVDFIAQREPEEKPSKQEH